MNITEAFPSNYLKAHDCDPDITLTIASVTVEEIGQGADKSTKPIIKFQGVEKGLVCNKVNANTITKVLGTPDTDQWIGKRITLYSTEVEFGGEVTLGIRVRLKTSAAAAPTQAAANTYATDPVVVAEVFGAFKQTLKPGTSPDDAKVLMTETAEAFFGQGVLLKNLTTAQWRKMGSSAFQPPSNPLESATVAGVAASDIPF